jgi:hypothetical protein
MSSEMMEIATRTSISVKAASAFANLWTIALPPSAVQARLAPASATRLALWARPRAQLRVGPPAPGGTKRS